MTTDQIRTTDAAVISSRDDAEVLSDATNQARQIIAKARYDAFRMVTDARAEAELILADTDRSVASSAAAGDDTDNSEIVEAARTEAQSIIDDARSQAADIHAEALAQLGRLEQGRQDLLAEHDRLTNRVESTRSLLTNLEARLTAIATGHPADPHPATVKSENTTTVDVRPIQEQGSAPGRKGMRAGAPPIEPAEAFPASRALVAIDYSPSVAPPIRVPEPDAESGDDNDASIERGSYYSRRSAHLPHISDTDSHKTLGSMKSLRVIYEP